MARASHDGDGGIAAGPRGVDAGGRSPGDVARMAYAALIDALAVTASLWVVVLMIAITADVVLTQAAGRPVYGVVEVTGKSIVAVVFFQLPQAVRHGRLAKADFLTGVLDRRSPGAGATLQALYGLTGAAVFGAVAWHVWPLMARSWTSGEYFGAQSVFTAPIWPIHAAIVLGAALSAIEFAGQGVAAARRAAGSPALAPASVAAGAVALVVLATWLATLDLPRPAVGAVVIATLIGLIVLAMPIPVAVMLCGAVGIWALRGNPDVALTALRSAATSAIDGFAFGVVPLFVLMGLILDRAGIGRDAYRVAAHALRRLPGGLGVSTVAANGVFAAVTGISIASAAVFSRVAVPQMVAAGYTPRFAAGCVAGSSVLGMLIPPSLLLIIYGFVSETSVGKLFVAAIVPGLILMTAFAALILVMLWLRPGAVGDVRPGAGGTGDPMALREAVLLLAPIAGLVALVLGGIYAGWFTPTQAGAIGAAAALALAVARGRLSARDAWEVLRETGTITVGVLILIVAASVLTKMLALSTIPQALVSAVAAAELGFWAFMLAYLAIVVALGMILDSTSIIVIMVPLVAGIVEALGAGVIGPDVMVWFGIVTVIAVEIGLLTPPFGITVYVVRAALPEGMVSLWDVFAGAFPFVVAMALVTLLLTLVPALSLIGV